MQSEAYIVDALRTPMGRSKKGRMARVRPDDMAAFMQGRYQPSDVAVVRELTPISVGVSRVSRAVSSPLESRSVSRTETQREAPSRTPLGAIGSVIDSATSSAVRLSVPVALAVCRLGPPKSGSWASTAAQASASACARHCSPSNSRIADRSS